MSKLSAMQQAIRLMQQNDVDVKSIAVSKNDREHMLFLLMKQARDIQNPTHEMAKRYPGILTIYGVEIE